MNGYEKVANTIVSVCDDYTIETLLAGLFKQLYENKTPKITFEENYKHILTIPKESEEK